MSGCSKLHTAIFAQSQQDVSAIIIADNGTLRERASGGLQALHLAIEWPDGIKLLLNLGANPGDGDDCGRTPLYYAIEFSCLQTVELLLSAGSPLSYDGKYGDVNFLHDRNGILDTAVYARLISYLAARRKELASYARENLPDQVIQDLHIDQHTVPAGIM